MAVMTAPRPDTSRARARTGSGLQGRFAALGFISPGVLLVAMLLYLPFLYSLYLSFFAYNGLGTPEFIGVQNYIDFFRDPALITSMLNTLMWVIGATVVPVGFGLVVAVLSHGLKRGPIYRLPFMLPYALSGAGLAVIWTFILQDGGGANQLLEALGLPGAETSFLTEQTTNTLAMIAAFTWQQLGVNVLLFMVGLQSIPKEPLEAARMDGANAWQLFRHQTWPMLAPLTTVVVGLSLVASLKTFDIVWVMTQGGPGRASETLAVTMYKDAFVSGEYGRGAAVAVALTAITGTVSYLYLRRQLSSREELGA